MIKKPVTIQTDMSTEDRSVALLVQEASQYQSQVFFEVEEKNQPLIQCLKWNLKCQRAVMMN